MGLAASERDVLKVISELETANRVDISRRISFSSAYVEFLCRDLVRRDYLKLAGKARYALTPRGRKAAASLRYVAEETRLVVDRKMVKDVASEVAKQVAKEITKGIRLRGTAPQPVAQEGRIQIKTEYVPGANYAEVELESNINRIGPETEEEKLDLGRSVELFKSIKKRKRK